MHQTHTRSIVLGSSSRWRRMILQKAGITFAILAPNIDEKEIRHPDPRILTLLIATAKAYVLIPRLKEHDILITSDQVAILNGHVLEKPRDVHEARVFLRDYAHRGVKTVTAVVVVDIATKAMFADVDEAEVFFKPIPDHAIDSAINRGIIMNACGALVLDDPDLAPYIEKIRGERESIDGLPLALTLTLLKKVGYTPPQKRLR